MLTIYNPLQAIFFSGRVPYVDADSKSIYNDKDHFTDYANFKYIFPDFNNFLKNEGLI